MAEVTVPSPLDPIVGPSVTFDRAFWLSAAHAAVRSECGWHVAPIITETLVLDGSGGRALLLPSKRVIEVISVTDDGTDVTADAKFSRRSGVMTLASRWSCDVGSIEITLKHGYALEEVADVAGVIAALVARSTSPAGVSAQAVGGASVKYATGKDGGVLSVPLLESEKETLAPYRLNWA